jgi:hypothetical protein
MEDNWGSAYQITRAKSPPEIDDSTVLTCVAKHPDTGFLVEEGMAVDLAEMVLGLAVASSTEQELHPTVRTPLVGRPAA